MCIHMFVCVCLSLFLSLSLYKYIYIYIYINRPPEPIDLARHVLSSDFQTLLQVFLSEECIVGLSEDGEIEADKPEGQKEALAWTRERDQKLDDFLGELDKRYTEKPQELMELLRRSYREDSGAHKGGGLVKGD